MRRLHLNLVAGICRKANTRKLRVLALLLLAFTVAGVLPRPAGAAAGDLDPNFGVGGKRTTDFFGNDDVGAAVAVQPDGKIVVAGVGLIGEVGDFVLARYTSDGALDSTFGTNGKVTTDFFGDIDIAFGVAIQPADGKIVVTGTAIRPASDHLDTFFALARYNTNGSLDSSFGTGGKVTSDVLGINIHQSSTVVFVQSALGIVIQSDNKIVVAGGVIAAQSAPGTFPAPLSDFGIARFDTNGALDSGFNGTGRVVRDFFGRNDLATSLALQADNKIVVAGVATKNVSPFDPDFAWVRYNTNGSQDTSIGNAGRVTTEFATGVSDGANAMVIQPDGKIVLGGFAGSTSSDMALIRYNADASLDGSFGTGGKLAINVFNSYDELFGLAVAADGKLVAAGGTITSNGTEDIVVARITTGGVLDPTFGTNGRVTTDFSGGDDFATALTLQPDGKIVVSGAADMGSFTDMAVLRYLAPPSGPPPTIQLSAATTSVNESGPQATITVTRTGDVSGASTVAYTTSDTASKECSINNGNASSSCDYITTVGTLQFAATETQKTINISIVDDAYDETDETFTFTLSNPTGATLGSPISSTVTIIDNDTANGPNPIDTSSFFVRQHYIDFFSREPDSPGLAFWIGEIENCTPKPQCTEIKRINVSAAFFLSIEFQETGYLVYRFYKASYGNISPNVPVPVRFLEFLPDTQQIGKGVIVNEPGYEAKLEANKVAYAQDFVTRSRFTTAYPTTLTPTQFVDALFANAGVTPSPSDRTAAINEFGPAGNTSDTAARARALRKVAENSLLYDLEKNRAFVLAQYFGYLRRNPNDPPEATLDFQGYNFWLGKLNQFNGNFIDAEMVKSFIISGEYRQRFGMN